MSYAVPPDVEQRVKTQFTRGKYKTEDEVLRAAMTALEREYDDMAAIQAGIEDMEAGRVHSFAETAAEFRKKHNIAPIA